MERIKGNCLLEMKRVMDGRTLRLMLVLVLVGIRRCG